jgi:hypothetical protein
MFGGGHVGDKQREKEQHLEFHNGLPFYQFTGAGSIELEADSINDYLLCHRFPIRLRQPLTVDMNIG